MMRWPSGVTANTRTHSGVPPEGVDERAVDVVQPEVVLVSARPTTKCTPSGSAATASHPVIHVEHALERAVDRPQLRDVIFRPPLRKRAPPGSTANPLM